MERCFRQEEATAGFGGTDFENGRGDVHFLQKNVPGLLRVGYVILLIFSSILQHTKWLNGFWGSLGSADNYKSRFQFSSF